MQMWGTLASILSDVDHESESAEGDSFAASHFLGDREEVTYHSFLTRSNVSQGSHVHVRNNQKMGWSHWSYVPDDEAAVITEQDLGICSTPTDVTEGTLWHLWSLAYLVGGVLTNRII